MPRDEQRRWWTPPVERNQSGHPTAVRNSLDTTRAQVALDAALNAAYQQAKLTNPSLTLFDFLQSQTEVEL